MNTATSRLLLSLTVLAALPAAPRAACAQDFATRITGSSHLGGAPYDDPTAALGAPAASTDDGFGDIYHDSMVYSAYGTDTATHKNALAGFDSSGQGTLTVRFDTPITHSAAHWYGEDFLVFSNQFFTGGPGFVNADGDPHPTDMSQYFLSSGATTGTLPAVSVSADGVTFYALRPASAVLFPANPYHWDGLSASEPTGWGALQDFTKPVNPALTSASFTTDPQGRPVSVAYAADVLYDGSAGGTPFTLAGLTDAHGQPITSISYIRFASDASGAGVVDAVSRVSANPNAAPEPGAWVVLGLGAGGLLTLRGRRRHAA